MKNRELTPNELKLYQKLVEAKRVIEKKIVLAIEHTDSQTISNYSRWLHLHFGNTPKEVSSILDDFKLEKQPLNVMECHALFNKYLTIDCTGDVCQGDFIQFQRAVFIGKYPKSTFSHMETVYAIVLKESYGQLKQQHTFTLLDVQNFEEIRIKGRNINKNGTTRLLWENEKNRSEVLAEKYERGCKARKARAERKAAKENPFNFGMHF